MPHSPSEPRQPSLWTLFLIASRIGISGFGGVLPLMRRSFVEELHILSGSNFNSLLGICQVMPGSNVVNLAVCIGARLHGAAGAMALVSGLLLAPFIGMMLLAMAYGQWGHLTIVQDMLRGIAAAGAGLLFATALKMAHSVSARRIYLPFSVAILLGLVIFRLPLPPLILSLLALATLLAYLRQKTLKIHP